MKLAPIIPTRRQEPFEDPEWGCDLKLDGFRGLADTINGRLLSKNLNPLKRYRQLLDALPLDCVFDGEVCALDQDGRPDFNALLFRKSEIFVGCARKLYATTCEMDLEGIVLKKLADPYDAERTSWWKVLNAGYSQKIDRAELFKWRAG